MKVISILRLLPPQITYAQRPLLRAHLNLFYVVLVPNVQIYLQHR